MRSRYAPSLTLLLHVGVALLGAALTLGFTTKVHLSPRPSAMAAPDIRLHAMTTIRMAIGAGIVLPAGSRWRAAGLLAQGSVYRPLNHVVLLEGPRVEEAWPVVSGDHLQGFFLPAEARFAPVWRPVHLPLLDSTGSP